jgi:hypothetical protein
MRPRARSSPPRREAPPSSIDGRSSAGPGETYALVYATVRGALDYLSQPDLDAARDAINAHDSRRSTGGGPSNE